MTGYSGQQLLAALADEGLADWQVLPEGIRTRYLSGDFASGLELVNRVGAAAEEANHHPDLGLSYDYLDVRLISHDVGAVTDRDLRMARRISDLAAELGISADPAVPQVVELALDTSDKERIAPFWAALLTGDAGNVNGPDVVDPSGQVPLLWFQDSDEHDVPHQRFHLDVWVPPAQADARIAAAVAAGGKIVDDAEAPSFTVLADADGNRACVCTVAGR